MRLLALLLALSLSGCATPNKYVTAAGCASAVFLPAAVGLPTAIVCALSDLKDEEAADAKTEARHAQLVKKTKKAKGVKPPMPPAILDLGDEEEEDDEDV